MPEFSRDVAAVSVIVPTFNEGDNVRPLVEAISAALGKVPFEVIFVDDSTDDTPEIVTAVAAESTAPVRLVHREKAVGGLSGAVIEGFRVARNDLCVVMDGDLQHPPATIVDMLATFRETRADIVIASRYVGGGDASGLAGRARTLVSRGSTALTKSMFPVKLRGCTDPMTGFFLVDRRKVNLDALQPRGFKILLEVLTRNSLTIEEVPFRFGTRNAGHSKATFTQGIRFLTQLGALRFGRASGFAIIGAIGAVANIGIMAGLTALGMGYVWAAVIAAETTIIGNFLLIERFVFADMRGAAGGWSRRFLKSFAFNNAEALVRIPILALLVETWHISSVLAATLTLGAAFIVRFAFHALVVYAPHKTRSASTEKTLEKIDDVVMQPGEL